jgi:hypothetical protein
MHREDICGLKDSPSHPVLITRLHPGSVRLQHASLPFWCKIVKVYLAVVRIAIM